MLMNIGALIVALATLASIAIYLFLDGRERTDAPTVVEDGRSRFLGWDCSADLPWAPHEHKE